MSQNEWQLADSNSTLMSHLEVNSYKLRTFIFPFKLSFTFPIHSDHVIYFQTSPLSTMKKLQISTLFPFSNNFFPNSANMKFFITKNEPISE